MPVPSPLGAVLLDLDGVLYVEEEVMPGAREAVKRLRSTGLGLRFVTNTTARSRTATLDKLHRLGFEVGDDELVTPASLAEGLCLERGHQRASLLMSEAVMDDLPQLERDDDEPQAVIVGDLGERFDYAVLNRAFRHVMAGAALVALQRNRYWRRADGLSLDVGPFVAALEYATGHDADVVGKPARRFFEGVLGSLGCSPERATMVGDDVESDVGGALAVGLSAILVRTGKFREDALRSSGVEPTAIVDSMAQVPELLGA